jgi:hypothetical protein
MNKQKYDAFLVNALLELGEGHLDRVRKILESALNDLRAESEQDDGDSNEKREHLELEQPSPRVDIGGDGYGEPTWG